MRGEFLTTIILCSIFRSLALLPNSLLVDFVSVTKRFDINYLTVFMRDAESCNNSVKLQPLVDRKKSIEVLQRIGLRASVIESHFITKTSRYKHGAIFSPITTLHNAILLIQNSNANRPVFFYSLTETALPDLFRAISNIPYTSRVYLILQDAVNDRMLRLKEVYHVHKSSTTLVVNEIGQRIETNKKSEWHFEMQSTLLRRENLQGTIVRVLYPIEMFDEVDSRGFMQRMWFGEQFFRIVTSNLNISISIVKLLDRNLFGSPSSSGDWPGVVGALIRGEASVSVIPYPPFTAATHHIDFLASCYASEFRFYYTTPVETYSLQTMVKGFTLRAWCFSFFFLVILSVGLFVTSRVPELITSYKEKVICFSECLLTILGDVCLQGWNQPPVTNYGRIFCISSVLTGFLLNLMYVSQLQAIILSDMFAMPFEDIEDLAYPGDYHVIMIAESRPLFDVNAATSGKFQKIANILRTPGGSVHISLVSAMQQICHRKSVVLGIKSFCDSLALTAPCSVSISKKILYHRGLSYVATKDFAFKKIFNFYIRKGVEGGLFEYQRRLATLNALRSLKDDSMFTAIEFIDVVPFLLLYAVFLAFTSSIFILELLCFHGGTRWTGEGFRAKLECMTHATFLVKPNSQELEEMPASLQA